MASIITHFEDAREILQYDPRQVVYDHYPRPLASLQSLASTLKHYVELAKATPCLKSTNSATSPPAAATRKNSSSLLKFDLGAVVLRQVGNSDILSKLEEFATRLEHFIYSAEQAATPQPGEVPSAPSPPGATDRKAAKKKRKRRRSAQPDAVPSAQPVTPPSSSRNTDTDQGPHQEAVRPDAAPSTAPPVAAVSPTTATDHSVGESDQETATVQADQEASPDAVQSQAMLPAESPLRRADRASVKEEDSAEESELKTPAAQDTQDSIPDAAQSESMLPAENPPRRSDQALMEEDPAEDMEPETPTTEGNQDLTPDAVKSKTVFCAESPPRRPGEVVFYTLKESTPNSRPEQEEELEQPNEPEQADDLEEPQEPENDSSKTTWPETDRFRTEHEANKEDSIPMPQSEKATSEDEYSFCTAAEAAPEDELTNNPRRVSEEFEADPLQGLYPHNHSVEEPESPVVGPLRAKDGKETAAQDTLKDLSDDSSCSEDEDEDEDESIPISQLKKRMATMNNPQSTATTNKKVAASNRRRTWVECDRCNKWRRLPGFVDEKKLPAEWYCEMNKGDPDRAHCSAPEEVEERDEYRVREPQERSAVVKPIQHPQQADQVGPQQQSVVLQQPLQHPVLVNQVQHPQQAGLREPQRHSVVGNKVQHLRQTGPRQAGQQSVVVNQMEHWQLQAGLFGQPQSIAKRGHQIFGSQVQHQQQTGLYGQLYSIANSGQQLFERTSSNFVEAPRPNVVQGLQRMKRAKVPPHPGMLFAQGTLNRSRETNRFLQEVLGDEDPAQHHGCNAENNEVSRLPQNAENAVTSPANATVESSTKALKRDSENAPDQPKPKRRKKTKKEKVKEEDLPKLPEAPKIEAPEGYKGTLAESKLKRSVGLTRATLNNHLSELGLSAKFNVPAFSTKGGKLSHMTFNSKWNQLPYTVDQTFKFWLGEGSTRLTSALHVHPEKNPNAAGYPLFWSQPSKCAGGSLCYYVGHFRCIKFDTTQKVMLKRERRQALLEFKLVEFKEEIEDKMSKIEQGRDSNARKEVHHNHQKQQGASEDQAVNSEVQQRLLYQQQTPAWGIMF